MIRCLHRTTSTLAPLPLLSSLLYLLWIDDHHRFVNAMVSMDLLARGFSFCFLAFWSMVLTGLMMISYSPNE